MTSRPRHPNAASSRQESRIPAPASEAQVKALARVRRLAYLLDDSIRIPGFGRIGLDPLIGLIPGAGDAAGALLSGYIVVRAARLGAPLPILLRMLLNVAVEAVVGVVPVLGDLFDARWKANARNAGLLAEYLQDERRVARSSGVVVSLVGLSLLLLFVGCAALTIYLLRVLFSLS